MQVFNIELMTSSPYISSIHDADGIVLELAHGTQTCYEGRKTTGHPGNGVKRGLSDRRLLKKNKDSQLATVIGEFNMKATDACALK